MKFTQLQIGDRFSFIEDRTEKPAVAIKTQYNRYWWETDSKRKEFKVMIPNRQEVILAT